MVPLIVQPAAICCALERAAVYWVTVRPSAERSDELDRAG
jgi:hypothetical protein